MKSKKVVIIIPTHRSQLSAEDKISLAHHQKFLKKYDTYFIIPNRVDQKNLKPYGFRIKKVDDKYFGSIRRYSNLLLTKKFYEDFKKYDFMFIYHFDALVLSNQLQKWADSGYDYIGSPWFRPVIAYLSHKKGSPISGGNGGFSLRNIHKCIKILDLVNEQATRTSENLLTRKLWFILAVILGKSHKVWLQAPALDYPYMEDGFWALEAPKYLDFKIAPFKTALQFGFERFPRKSFELNRHQLPFGVHAWKRYDAEFWKPYIISKSKKLS